VTACPVVPPLSQATQAAAKNTADTANLAGEPHCLYLSPAISNVIGTGDGVTIYRSEYFGRFRLGTDR
jgi:hypothetical protein